MDKPKQGIEKIAQELDVIATVIMAMTERIAGESLGFALIVKDEKGQSVFSTNCGKHEAIEMLERATGILKDSDIPENPYIKLDS